ncbi:MAG: class I SAM-dependent methyltransferase [Mesorhizobium sp.]|uniref:class I SAM-dependent methyltransferase n=1 Tax=Mesorhizobium sp. TaxID=1871066 RepID=UPI00121CC981|nr:methyltransferase domain-containing protein [Mesorhizobium sp.]TIQ35434.1 MAG: class I SAM-dependent methyltransferase [Mesorhizobium sp.]
MLRLLQINRSERLQRTVSSRPRKPRQALPRREFDFTCQIARALPYEHFARRHLACVQHEPNCITYAMAVGISERISAFVEALPLKPGLQVLEIGCGPGVAARAVARRIGDGFILAIDRSEKAIRLARAGSADEIASGRLDFRQAAIEDFTLLPGDTLFDIAFAMRVGALDGRHPETGRAALMRIKAALKPSGRLFIDGGDPLKEIDLSVA